MKHLFSSRIRAVLIVALVLAVVLTITSSLLGVSIPDMAVKGILTPVRTGVSKLTDKAEQLYSYIFEYEALAAENAELKAQLAQMEEDARRADSISRENAYLREVLDLKKAHEDYVLLDSYVIGRESVDWSSAFTINRGSGSGIQPGMCAITSNGELVGLVSEVGPNYSVVKTVLDSSLEISSTISASGYSGMVQGGYATGLKGLLRMDYLPSSAVIRNNDQVVTAGSTIYPRGLIIGNVVDAGFDSAGVAKYALLEPAADIGSLEIVLIITQYEAG